MPDMEKVIQGLHYCTHLYLGCKECPYFGTSTSKASCEYQLKADAIALLKEQEEEIKRLKNELHGFGDLFGKLSEKTEKTIAEQPKIVRCKNCKYYPNGEGTTTWTPCKEIITPPYWFCADGKPREGDGSV